MGKKKGKSAPPPERVREVSSRLLTESLAMLQEEYGDAMIGLASDAGFSTIGLPLPSLAMEYLLLSTVWPINSRLSMLVGPQAAGKTMLLSEIMRWNYHYCAGHNYQIVTEYSKHSYDLSLSIMGWEYSDGLAYIPAPTMNEWQSRLLSVLRNERVLMDGPEGYSQLPGMEQAQSQRLKQKRKYVNKKRKTVRKSDLKSEGKEGIGRIYPVVVGIDAVMSVATVESCIKIETDGFAAKEYANEASSITKFLRALPQAMYGYPFHCIGVNHLKEKPPEFGQLRPERSIPGGKHLLHHEALELELHKIGSLQTAAYEGQTVLIKCIKNCLGTSGRQIAVDVKWWNENVELDGVECVRQRTVFDWYAATMKLLLGKLGSQREVKSVLDLQTHSQPGQSIKVSSQALGIPRSEPVPLDVAGYVLQNTPHVLEPLRDIFGIKRYPVFQLGQDYRDQMEEAKRRIRLQEARRVQNAETDEETKSSGDE